MSDLSVQSVKNKILDNYETRIRAQDVEIERLRSALEIIAGYRQCPDNLMSNVEIARAALPTGRKTG